MKYKAVIFDLDGTLLNSLEDLANSMNAVLVNYGFTTHPVEAYKYFVGNGMQQLVKAAAPEKSDDIAFVNLLVEEMRSEYDKRWNARTKPYNEINELLQHLENNGLPKCILSNKPDDFTKIVVNYFFSTFTWSAVYGHRQGIPRKPDPAGALAIANELSLSPGEILYVGDTNTDMKTAVAAGMYPVGVLWGFRTRQELIESGAKTIIKTPLALLDVAFKPY